MRNRLVIFIVVFSLLALFNLSAQGKYLNVQNCQQEHSNWCWDACSQCIIILKGSSPSQCTIANYALYRSDCCGTSTFNWNHPCNTTNSLQSIVNILSNWSISASVYNGSFSWSGIQSRINGNRPFVMGFRWHNGGGHVVVGYGYWTANSTNYVGYMDPWPGEGYTWSTYNNTVYSNRHSWSSSVQTY